MAVGSGHGTQVTFGSFVAKIDNVNPFSYEVDDIDMTHMLSDAKEFVPGTPDYGETTVEIKYDPAVSTADLLDRQIRTITVTFPAGETFECDAYCNGFEPEIPEDDEMTATATFKLTGEPSSIP